MSVLRNATAVVESTRNSRAGIEAVPTEPEQTSAERDQRNAVRPAIDDLAFADVENGRERGDAGDVVHDDSAGEIFHAPLREDAAAPDHVDERKVNEDQPRRQEQHVSLERDAVGECAGNQRRA